MTPKVPLRQALALAGLPGRGLLAANLLLQVLQGVVPLLGLLAMQHLLDTVARGIGAADRDAAMAEVAVAVGYAAAVALAGMLVRAAAAQVGDRHARLAADRCTDQLQRHAAALDLLQIEDPANVDLLARAGAEASQRPVRVVHNLAALLLAAVTFMLLGATLATVSPLLPLAVGLAAAPQAFARLAHARAQLAWQEQRTQSQRELGYRAALLVGRAAAKDLRLNDRAAALADAAAAQRLALTQEQLLLQRRRSWHDALAQALAAVAMFAAYLYLGRLALARRLTLGGLLLHAQAVQRTQNGLRDGLLAWSGLREDRLFLAQLFAFLALQPRIVAPAVPVPVPVRPGTGIEFADVHFTYPGARAPALRGVTFGLRPGEKVALIGQNGAGKSTIVRLLSRLCDPDAGTVTCGGIDLRRFAPAAFRARLSVFFQDAAALEFTARENLALGAPALDDRALLQAADEVGIGDRLRQLPHGLDTRLGRGFHGAVELSVGEWRRLLLARALARPSEILVLDEPFAFLDGPGQERLIAALQEPARQQSILVIDHRLHALHWVDRVLVCEAGRIVADGPAASVLQRS